MSERLGDLTSRERELVDAAALGDVLECSQLSIEQLSATGDPEHTIRAELLRELLLKRCDKPLDPRGVRLRGARITGTLDLTHVHGAVGMELRGCSFDHRLLLEDAHLPWLALTGSCVPALDGDRLEVDGDLFLDEGFRAAGHGEFCVVRLLRAHIAGQLVLRDAELTNDAGLALAGDGLQVDGDLFLQGFRAAGYGEFGVVQLRGAHIIGQLVLTGAELTNEAGPALAGDRIQIDDGLFLDEGFRAIGHSEDGAVQLRGAHIASQLSLAGAELTNEAGPALAGDALQIDGDLFLDKGFRATGHGQDGAVRLLGAHITGQLVLRGAELTNEAGPALQGDRLQVDDGLFLDEGFRATGHGQDGAVRLPGAHITGQLSLAGAELTNEAGPALHGDRLQVDGNLTLRRFRATGHGEASVVRLLSAHITGQLSLAGTELTNMAGPALAGDRLQVDSSMLFEECFRATGHGERGAVRLLGAHIIGQLSLRGAELTNKAGPALHGDQLQVDNNLFLDEGFRATGHGVDGVVRLSGSHIAGSLVLTGAELTNEAGPALYGDQLRVDDNLFLDEGFRATGHGERSVVLLRCAHITGQLVLRGAELTNEDGVVLDLTDAEVKTIFVSPEVVCPQGVADASNCDAGARRVNLSGFVYTSLEDSHWSQWLHLITRHTNRYRPQPYQQLADVRRAAGHDADARKILITQQQDLHKRGDLGGWLIKTRHYLWGKLGCYGYRTSRTAFALLIVLLVAAGLGIAAGCIHTSPDRYVAMRTAQTDDPHGPCSLLEQIGIGIDRGLPLATTGIRSRCDFDTTSHWGQVITAASWILQFLVWALATLVVAGYVGFIRKVT